MNYCNDIYLLNSQFYLDYPQSRFPEIMTDPNRPYNIVIYDDYYDIYVCVPIRTNVHHNNCFRLPQTITNTKPGVDYSKMVIFKDSRYFDKTVLIDQIQMATFHSNSARIHSEIKDYLDKYIKHVKGENVLSNGEFRRKYLFSTLPYFHNELGIGIN